MKLDLSLPYKTKDKILLIGISLVTSALMIVAYNATINAYLNPENQKILDIYSNNTEAVSTLSPLESIAIWPAIAIAIGTVFHLINLAYDRIERKPNRISAKLTPRLNAKSIIIFTAIVLVTQLPYRLAYLPSYIDLDTFMMLSQFYDWAHPLAITYNANTSDQPIIDNALTNHHPITDALIYVAFAAPSMELTGSWNAGLLVLSCIQQIIITAEIIWCIAWARSKGARPPICLVALISIIAIPIFPYYAISVVKDVTHSICFIPWLVCLIETILTKGKALYQPKWAVVFVITGILCALTKQTGPYIICATMVALLIAYRHQWITPAMQLLLVATISFAVMPLVVFPALDVAPGGKQEMLATPMNQMVSLYKQGKLDTAQTDALQTIVDLDGAAEYYASVTTDEVKNYFKQDATQDDIKSFLLEYARAQITHPIEFTNELLGINGGYIAPVKSMFVHPNHISMDQYIVRRVYIDPSLPTGDTVLSNMSFSKEQMAWFPDALKTLLALPGISAITSIAMWSTLIPLALAWCAYRMRRLNVIAFIPYLIMFGFCLIGPVVDMRYAWCIFLWDVIIACVISAPTRRPLHAKSRKLRQRHA